MDVDAGGDMTEDAEDDDGAIRLTKTTAWRRWNAFKVLLPLDKNEHAAVLYNTSSLS